MTDRPDAPRTFAGAVAIITGGASGIGRALAEVLADRTAEVVGADLQRALATRPPPRTGPAHLDVTDFAAVGRLVEQTAARWSPASASGRHVLRSSGRGDAAQ